MRVDHASSALAKVDLIQTLLLFRLLANYSIVQIVREIITLDVAVSDDRSSCLIRLSLF
jgi:hypothetical protein